METPQELDIKKYLQLFYQKRYVFFVTMVIVTSIIIAYSYRLPKIYKAESTVLMEKNYVNDLIKGLAATPSMDDRVKALEATLKSRSLVLKVMGDLDLELTRKSDLEVEKLVQAFQESTDVYIVMNKISRTNMDMFTVSLKNRNPVVARDYVNVLVRTYIEESLSHSRDETYGANKFLLEQINLYKDKLSAIEADIARMSRRQTQTPRIAVVVAQDRLPVLQKRLEELRLQYTDSHPEILKVKAEIESLKSQSAGGTLAGNAGKKGEQQQPVLNSEDPTNHNDVAQNLGAAESGNAANEPVDTTRKQGAAFSTSVGADKQKISALERDRDTYRKIYEDLMAALGRSEVSSRIEVQDKGGTFKILEPAILPIDPISPNRVKIILLGLFAGIGGGIGLIFLLDIMDNSVKTVDMLKTFGLPVLSVIPRIQNPAEIQKTKRNDILLYVASGVYLVCVIGLLSFEAFKRGVQ